MTTHEAKESRKTRYPMAGKRDSRSWVREQPTLFASTSSAGMTALQEQSRQPTFIDLFCGCGGFSLGMMRAGFRCLAAIDSNPEAITVFRRNLNQVGQALHKDLTRFPPSALASLIDSNEVDAIVGGPPLRPQRLASGYGMELIKNPSLN